MERHAVEAEVLELTMRVVEDGSARVLIDAAGLHADEAVLTDIDDADAVARADLVELGEELDRAELLAVDADRNALFKVDGYILRFVCSILRRFRDEEHAVVRLVRRILEVGALMGEVPDIAVHGVRLVLRRDGDAVLLRVLDLRGTGVEVPLAPRSDELDVRRERFDRELEAHLVVALARRTVGDGVSTLFLRNLDELLRDERTRKRRAEQVLLLIDSTSLERRPDVLLEEFLLDVLDVDLRGAGLQRLVMDDIELIALSDIGTDRDDLAAVVVLLEPGDDDGGIETAGICKYYFFDFVCHSE